jgi:hypothetical protein
MTALGRAIVLGTGLALLGCSSDQPSVLCEDARSTVVRLLVDEANAGIVAAITASGTGCAPDSVTCASQYPGGTCGEYQVAVSLDGAAAHGACTIQVAYSDGRPAETVTVAVSQSDCGPVAGVDGNAQVSLPIGRA